MIAINPLTIIALLILFIMYFGHLKIRFDNPIYDTVQAFLGVVAAGSTVVSGEEQWIQVTLASVDSLLFSFVLLLICLYVILTVIDPSIYGEKNINVNQRFLSYVLITIVASIFIIYSSNIGRTLQYFNIPWNFEQFLKFLLKISYTGLFGGITADIVMKETGD